MKKGQILVIHLFAALLFSCNSTPETLADEEIVYPKGAVVVPYSDMEGLVKLTLYDRKGILVGDGEYLNGKRHGTWTEYEPYTMMVRKIDSYRNGELHGASFRINRDGELISKYSYYNGQFHGTNYKYKNKRAVEEKNYVMGELEGVSILYYDNGNKKEEVNYENGQMEGIAKWYDQEGNIKFQYLYKAGKLVDQNPVGE